MQTITSTQTVPAGTLVADQEFQFETVPGEYRVRTAETTSTGYRRLLVRPVVGQVRVMHLQRTQRVIVQA